MSSNISGSIISAPSNEEHFWHNNIHPSISPMLVPEDIINLTRVSQCFKKWYSEDAVWRPWIEGYRNLQGEVVEIPQPSTVSYKQFYEQISKNNMTNISLNSGIWSKVSSGVIFQKKTPNYDANNAGEWKPLSRSSVMKICKLIEDLLKNNSAFVCTEGIEIEAETVDATTRVKATIQFRVKGDQHLHKDRQQIEVDYDARLRTLEI